MTASESLPLVSVVIPAYQAAATLQRTLASAQAQSLRQIEILVVDDGSTDATGAIAQAAAAADNRIRLIRQANAGVAAARNAGIAAAQAEWIAPLDADDLWHPAKLARQLAAVRAAPTRPSMVYCWSRRIDGEDRVVRDYPAIRHRGDVFGALLVGNFLNSASIPLLHRDVVARAGGFDAGLRGAGAQGAEDLQMWLAAAECGPVELAPAYLVGYRLVAGGMSRAAHTMRRSFQLVLDEQARRRPDLSPALLRAGNISYDLYAASVSLESGDWASFARYLRSAARRDVRLSSLMLAQAVLGRIHQKRDGAAIFDRLDPDEAAGRAPLGRLEAPLGRTLQRALQGHGAG